MRILLGGFLLILAGCQNLPSGTALTPPVVQPNTPTSLPPTATAVSPATAARQTSQPTNPPPAPPTELPAAIPTDRPPTPLPPQPVSQVHLAPLITDGLTKPVYLTHAGDGRLFIVEQIGRIRIFDDKGLLPEPFLDIQSQVSTDANERGLFSIAFHPQYEENGRFFINYTNRQGNTVISRFRVSSSDSNRAEPASEEILLTIPQPYGNHNGGQLAFGPDGNLYIGMGDGGSGGDPDRNGQNPKTLLGALLRLDVDHEGEAVLYSIPADNPFIDDNEVRNEIWAIGLRNPWRFSFDRLTGDLYIGDVGQNQWEELNYQAAASTGGENYGWNIMEGNHCFQPLDCNQFGYVVPVFEYGHDKGCSITGGYVYRGVEFPELAGNYFFGDYCTGTLWRLLMNGNGSGTTAVVHPLGFNISSFGEDVNGELYVLDHRGGVYQLQP